MFARIIMSVALIALFAGCASYDNGYRDGAYYRPARGDEGDYYYGRPVPQHRGYYNPYYGPYGAPFYYSPYPYYRPYRYRPYYGPYRSSYYGSGFGASYAYGGFSGYRDFGHSYLGLGFVYSDRDHGHDRGRHDRRGRNERDARRSDRADRFGVAPIIDGSDRRDTLQRRPAYADERREYERRRAQPTPRQHAAPVPAAIVRMPPGESRVVQMRRVDADETRSKNKDRSTQPVPRPTRAPSTNARSVGRVDAAPTTYRGTSAERQAPAHARSASVRPSSRSPAQTSSPQRGLNERTREGGKKTRNSSHLEKSSDTLDE